MGAMMKTVRFVVLACAVLGLSACASSDAKVLRMSNVWHTSCGAGSGMVVVSAPTLREFHEAVEKTPECSNGYKAEAPTR